MHREMEVYKGEIGNTPHIFSLPLYPPRFISSVFKNNTHTHTHTHTHENQNKQKTIM